MSSSDENRLRKPSKKSAGTEDQTDSSLVITATETLRTSASNRNIQKPTTSTGKAGNEDISKIRKRIRPADSETESNTVDTDRSSISLGQRSRESNGDISDTGETTDLDTNDEQVASFKYAIKQEKSIIDQSVDTSDEGRQDG